MVSSPVINAVVLSNISTVPRLEFLHLSAFASIAGRTAQYPAGDSETGTALFEYMLIRTAVKSVERNRV